jgi:hypothetical protein
MLALSASGCLGYLHPVKPAPDYSCPPPLPHTCQQHVHIFFVTGLDPLDYANLNGVAEYLHSLGYNSTYVGQMFHADAFEAEIRRLSQEDPNAHFVLIGFSFGANIVRNIANNLMHSDNIPIDLLVYLGGNTLEDVPETQPENVGKVINVLGVGWIWHGSCLPGAENLNIEDRFHFGTPTHGSTLNALACELTEIAARVPFCELITPPPDEQLPVTPRPVKPPPAAAAPDEWDFLKPAKHLQPLDR